MLVALAAVAALGTAVALGAAPGASTGNATEVGPNGATVHGSVNPQGEATTYHFSYGTTGAYGSTTPETSAGSGVTAIDVNASLTGLKPHTTYHYRVAAKSSQGTKSGGDRTFTTPTLPPPGASTLPAGSVTGSSATLRGNVDPKGQATTYHFSYGLTNRYGSRTAEASAGDGTESRGFEANVTGLTPGKRYHFRIVARSAGGSKSGGDRVFTTESSPKAVVSTGRATAIRADSATLRGLINPKGEQTTYHFQYGPTVRYGSRTPDGTIRGGNTNIKVGAAVGGLAANKVYHFRLVATGPGGNSVGRDRRFRTLKARLGFTIAAAPNPVIFGHRASLSGRLSGTGNAGRQVILQQRTFPFGGAWAKLAGPVPTDGRGAFFFGDLRPAIATQLRVVTADNKVTSRAVTVRVAVRVSTRARKRVKRHRRVRFAGTVRPARDGTPFAIQKRRNGRWVTVAGGVTKHRDGSSSRYARRIRVHRGGRYRVFVRVTGGGLTTGIGRTVRIRTFK